MKSRRSVPLCTRIPAAASWLLLVAAHFGHVQCDAHDIHGGVAMGQVNVCDDAKTYIAIDWDPSSIGEYTCDGTVIRPSQLEPKIENKCTENIKQPIHVCYPHEITYTDIPPTSGRHRPNWPVYGEYIYLPPQRWLHSLEHGAVVMLYHPCADEDEVEKLRDIVTHCLRKHIITPYKLLPRGTPLALLTWGCKLLMSSVTDSVAHNFIKEHGMKAPESSVMADGHYNTSLDVKADVVSNYNDEVICPESPANGAKPSKNIEPSVGTGYKIHQDQGLNQPPLKLILMSKKRHEGLNKVTEKLQNSMQKLIEIYHRLVKRN